MITCKPFVKWAGGKTQLLPELVARLPRAYTRYVEPFVGGGALFFETQPQTALLLDANPDLMNAYLVVRDQIDALVAELRPHLYDKEHYYRIRNVDRNADYAGWSPAQRAARLIYLNKTCFNGLYRVNRKGQFNVPFGRYANPTICDEANLRRCHQVLQGVTLREAPFTVLAEEVRPGDFVYFDPPYAPTSATSNFTGYSLDGFGEADQRALRELCGDLDGRGVQFMLSNSFTELAQELYKDFRVEVVQATRAINAKANRRGRVNELVIRNY